MPRSKVKLEIIPDENARRTSFRKRMPSLMKKMNEICTLCGIQACVIMHSAYEPDQLELWPDRDGVQEVVDRFKAMPNIEQNKKMLNQDNYIQKRIAKAEELLEKQARENHAKRMDKLKSLCLGDRAHLANLNQKELKDLVSFGKEHLSEIEAMIVLRKSGVPAVQPPPPPPPPPVQQVVTGGSNTTDPVVAENPGGLDGGLTVEDYVPEMVENSGVFDGGLTVEDYIPVGEDIEALDGLQSDTSEWFTDWMEDMEEHVLMYSDDSE